MFISDKFIFLELHKTGCTHIRKILNRLLDGEFRGTHNQASPNLCNSNRVFLGSVRDPWEWYTSLWAFGCDKKGSVFKRVTRRRRSIRESGWKNYLYATIFRVPANISKISTEWLDTYRDVNDAEAFRTWLHMMHDAKNMPNIREGYSGCYCESKCWIYDISLFKIVLHQAW